MSVKKKGVMAMVYKPKNNYSWGDGWSPNLDANIVGGVVEKIEAEHGAVTKELLLEESRPEDSATHSIFEWDNDKAAESWRLQQAKQQLTHYELSMYQQKMQKFLLGLS